MRRTRRGRLQSAFPRGFQPDREPDPGDSLSQAALVGGEEETPEYLRNPEMEMPVEEIEGNGYIGLLEIPALGLSLPVMSEWSYPNLKLAPCRYSGSAYTGISPSPATITAPTLAP